jgi:DNA-binding MarR family transcriptional regulator
MRIKRKVGIEDMDKKLKQDDSDNPSQADLLEKNPDETILRTKLPPNPKISPEKILEKDEIILVPHRFNIMLLLYSEGEIGFTVLQKILQLTPGNLDHHIKKLKEKGWLRDKMIYSYRPLTVIEITDQGREAFYTHANRLKQVLKGI